MGIKFEYTSPSIPQMSKKCEHKFATLYGKVRIMLNGARLTPNLHHGLWNACAACATIEKDILLSDKSPVPPYKVFLVWIHHSQTIYVRLEISESSQMYRIK